jgi:alpha-1,2-mannosyltransferase
MVGKSGSILARSKSAEFYLIRFVLAAVCAGCEARLCSVISRTLNPRIGILFLVIMAFSPGMLHASVALLPSSFAMYTSMLGLASFMDWHGGSKITSGIMWFGIGGIVGWPFASALIAPFILEEIVLAWFTGEYVEITRRFLDGIVRSLIVLVCPRTPCPHH